MTLENGGDDIVPAYPHGDGTDVRGVRDGYLQGRIGRDPARIWRDGDGGPIHILEKDVTAGNQREQDKQAQKGGEEIFFAHGDSFHIQKKSVARFRGVFKE